MKSETRRMCLNCVHFNNSPEYIESVFRGLRVLGSGYSSVKKDDGICALKDIYLSADNVCDEFHPKNRITPQARVPLL